MTSAPVPPAPPGERSEQDGPFPALPVLADRLGPAYVPDHEIRASLFGSQWPRIVARWLLGQDLTDRSRKTYRSIGRCFGHWIEAQGIAMVCPEHLIAYKEYLVKDGRTAYSVNLHVSVVTRLFGWLESRGLAPNLARLAGLARVKVARGYTRRALFDHEIKAFIATYPAGEDADIRQLRDFAIARVMLVTGQRSGGLAGADVGDVRVAGLNAIPCLAIRPKGHISKDHLVAIPPATEAILGRYLRARDAKPEEPLFANADGGRLSARSIQRGIVEHLRAAGVNDRTVTPHSIRHTAASVALEQGVDLAQIQAMLGHSDIRTTSIYCHARDRWKNPAEVQVEKHIEQLGAG